MKVILISQDFYPLTGGIATYLLQIYENYFSGKKFITLVPKSISENEDYKKFKFPVYRFNFSPFKTFDKRTKENQEILKFLIQEKPDLILFGYLRSHPEVARRYKQINPNCKFGIILHAKEAYLNSSISEQTNVEGVQKGYTRKEIFDYKKILNESDFLITVSNFTKKLIRQQGIKNRIFTINPLLNNIPIRNKKNLHKKGELNLLSVGRLIKRKGQEDVIRSIKKIKKIIPELRYVVVGEGPEKERLKTIAKELSVEENILFTGKISEKDLKKYYQNSDIFILPNKYIPPNDIEGFGIVFLEANSYGLPTIGCKNGGVAEAIQNNKTGFLIKESDQKEIIKRILFLYNNPRKLTQIGEAGRKRVLKKFYKNRNKRFVKYLDTLN